MCIFLKVKLILLFIAVEVKMLRGDQERDASNFRDPKTNEQLETIDCQPLLEWWANNYTSFGTTLEFVTDKSQEGAQFCKGFGGIGGILRYRVDFLALGYDSEWLLGNDALGPYS